MLRNLFKLYSVRQVKWHLNQIRDVNVRLKSTQVFSGETNNTTSDKEVIKKPFNPFAREVSETKNNRLNGFNDQTYVELSDTEKDKRFKVLQLEVDIANQEGRRVPSLDFFKEHHWEHVLTLSSKSARMKYYNFLWQIEMKKESKQRKKEEKAAAAMDRMEKVRKERAENSHIIYGLGHVSMFLRIYDSTINHWMNHR